MFADKKRSVWMMFSSGVDFVFVGYLDMEEWWGNFTDFSGWILWICHLIELEVIFISLN
jgi:hypothetical protein